MNSSCNKHNLYSMCKLYSISSMTMYAAPSACKAYTAWKCMEIRSTYALNTAYTTCTACTTLLQLVQQGRACTTLAFCTHVMHAQPMQHIQPV